MQYAQFIYLAISLYVIKTLGVSSADPFLSLDLDISYQLILFFKFVLIFSLLLFFD